MYLISVPHFVSFVVDVDFVTFLGNFVVGCCVVETFLAFLLRLRFVCADFFPKQ